MYKNPRGPFYVKPPKKGGKFSPKISRQRAQRMIGPLLRSKLELTSVPKGFFYKKLKFPLAMIGSFISRDEKVTCRTFKRNMWKSFINVNKEKIRYCYRVYDSLQEFDIDRFKKSILLMRMKLKDLLDLKSGFYCSICDYDRQSMFDHKNKLMLYSTDFCIGFLKEYKELINFQNVILIEYMDQMLQLIECYRGNGRFFDFPYRTTLEMHKRRIFFIQRCFAHKMKSNDSFEQEGFLKNCMFICNQFNYISYSRFIDGDIRMLNIVLMRIFQYLREMRFSPYIKLPPYQFLIPYEYPAVRGSALEDSKKYSNDLDKFIKKQLKIGTQTFIPPDAMTKNNKEDDLRERVKRLQYNIFFKKQRHIDLSIDSISFNKMLRKRLEMEKMQSEMPPTYIPNKIKMAMRERKERARQKAIDMRRFGMRNKKKASTRNIIRDENKIIRGVRNQFEKAARLHRRNKRKMKRMKKKGKEAKARYSRKLNIGKQISDQLESIKNVEDPSLMETVKKLQDDNVYYGVDPKKNKAAPVIDSDHLSTMELINQKIIPERRLSKKKSKKGRKSKKGKKKKKKKKIIILTTKVKDSKTGKYKVEKVPHRVTSWGKHVKKLFKKKKKKFERFKELSLRQSGEFAYYPPDSEHIMHGIYQEKRQFYDLKKYKPMYLVHLTGLNPLVDSKLMNLDIDPQIILRKEYNVRNPEKFNRNVILQYFGIPNKTITDFNFDISKNHYTDLVKLKQMGENPKANSKKAKQRAKKYKKRNRTKQLNEAQTTNEMMRKHHVYPKKHKNPTHHELGLSEYDPATSDDTDSQLMFYMFDHRSRYPIFRNS